MKKLFGALALSLVLASCATQNSEVTLFPESDFNVEHNGQQVSLS